MDNYFEFVKANIKDSSQKFAFFLLDYELITEPIGTSRHRLKQDLLTSFVGLTTGPNHFIFHLMEKTVQHAMPSGIYQHFKELDYWNIERKNWKFEAGNLKVIKVEDLKFLFVIWMVTLGISAGLFIGEILVKIGGKEFESLIGIFMMVKNLERLRGI